jgi:MFS transporter, MHS family, proline/betaine transporter
LDNEGGAVLTSATDVTHFAEEQRGQSRRSLLVAAFGTVIEWYDFSLYLYIAPVLTFVFFGGNEQDLVLTFGVFATAYVLRPVGAIVFGHLGDRIGRRQALVISAGLMAVAMLGVALLPSRSAIGPLAGVLLFLFRCLAGFSVGAEYTGILVFLLEAAPPRSRGYYAAWAAANSELGALLAVGVSTLLATSLSQAQLYSWGWRVTFVVGAALAALMIVLRSSLEETAVFRRVKDQGKVARSPLKEVLTKQRRAVLLAFVLSGVGSISYYLNISYVPTFLSSVGKFTSANALLLSTLAAVVVLVVTPPLGLLADRTGRRPALIAIAAGLAVTTIPLFFLLLLGSTGAALAGVIVLAIPAAAWSAVAASAIPEQFAASGRFSGMAIGYNLATAVFGGLSPLIATLLLNATGWKLAPAAYSAVVALAAIPFLITLRETARKPLPDQP